jgi:prepilin-type N-terminal cleavage/methylation domain-containing protein
MKTNATDFNNGFSLVEVMIALVVLLIGMLGVMGMQYYSVSGNAASREIRVATNLSQQLVEQMKSTPYINLASNTDVPALNAAMSGGINFTRAWWVVPDCVGLAAGGNLCAGAAPACTTDPDGAVAVQASAIRTRTCWTDRQGVAHSVTLDSMRWNENAVP